MCIDFFYIKTMYIQLFLFFKDDMLIRYKKINKTGNYFCDIYQEKTYLLCNLQQLKDKSYS
jgi:hypothetical protein